MITCCYKCTERWIEDGRNCHSTCKRYADALAEEARKRELRNEALAGDRELKAYKKQHYKAVDRRNQSEELLRRKRY